MLKVVAASRGYFLCELSVPDQIPQFEAPTVASLVPDQIPADTLAFQPPAFILNQAVRGVLLLGCPSHRQTGSLELAGWNTEL